MHPRPPSSHSTVSYRTMRSSLAPGTAPAHGLDRLSETASMLGSTVEWVEDPPLGPHEAAALITIQAFVKGCYTRRRFRQYRYGVWVRTL